MYQKVSVVRQNRRKTHPLSILARFRLGPSTSCTPRGLVPAMFPEYVDPGSVAGRYEKTGFLGSRFATDCCTDNSAGGPGRISVARATSPSRWGGCTTGTPDNLYAGALAMEVMVLSERWRDEVVVRRQSWSQAKRRGSRPTLFNIQLSIYQSTPSSIIALYVLR
jgi:hypothetical protein